MLKVSGPCGVWSPPQTFSLARSKTSKFSTSFRSFRISAELRYYLSFLRIQRGGVQNSKRCQNFCTWGEFLGQHKVVFIEEWQGQAGRPWAGRSALHDGVRCHFFSYGVELFLGFRLVGGFDPEVTVVGRPAKMRPFGHEWCCLVAVLRDKVCASWCHGARKGPANLVELQGRPASELADLFFYMQE